MSLSYVDARDVLARSQFIEDSPTTLEGEPLEIPQAPIFVMPEAHQTQQHGNNTQRPSREKRPYRRVTNDQRLELANLFRQHGDDKPAEWYPPVIWIRLALTWVSSRSFAAGRASCRGALPAEVARRAVPAPDRSLSEQAHDHRDASRRRLCTGRACAGALFCDEGAERDPHHVDCDDRRDGDGRLFPRLWVVGPHCLRGFPQAGDEVLRRRRRPGRLLAGQLLRPQRCPPAN